MIFVMAVLKDEMFDRKKKYVKYFELTNFQAVETKAPWIQNESFQYLFYRIVIHGNSFVPF